MLFVNVDPAEIRAFLSIALAVVATSFFLPLAFWGRYLRRRWVRSWLAAVVLALVPAAGTSVVILATIVFLLPAIQALY